MLSLFAKLLAILNSDSEPKYIALAISLAMMAGFSLTLSLVSLLVLVLLFSLRVHIGAFLMFYALFSLLALILNPAINSFGEMILLNENLNPIWQSLYQQVWFRVLEYNDTYQMGGSLIALLLAIPVFIASLMLINTYREKFMAFVNKFKVVKSLKASVFYRAFEAANKG